VREGASPTLDADETRVEVNRIASLRIDYQAKAEVALLALKEAVGIDPEEPIRLKGALEIAPREYDPKRLLQLAMGHRPDLAVQRANEVLANAELRRDRAEGIPDASVFGGYQRPDSGFSQEAFDAAGNLRPIRQTFNYATFGLNINLPLLNRNQGEAAGGNRRSLPTFKRIEPGFTFRRRCRHRCLSSGPHQAGAPESLPLAIDRLR
jgi:cobalt-zinc-cadmium efflux system outer membrane protein